MLRLPTWAAVALLTAAAFGVALLAIRVAVPPLFATRPDLVASFLPADPETMFRLATRDYATTRRVPSIASPAALEDAARRVPLGADPFVFTAIRELGAGDGGRATRLLEEARHRNPRHRLARALLVERYVREQRAVEAGVELTALNRLVPDASKIIGESLAELARDPKTFDAVAVAMRGDPALDTVLVTLANKGAPPALILRLAQYRGVVPVAAAAGWRSVIVDRLVKTGDYAQAKSLWSRFAGVSSNAHSVFNPGFAPLPAPPPFNWALASGDVGVAEIRRRGGLSAEFYGRASGPLVSQLTMLTPGRYRLSFVAEGDAKGQSSRLAWMLRCAERGKAAAEGRELLNASIKNVGGTPRRLRADFTVPAGCPAQWLVLEGLASEFRDNEVVEITDFSVQRVAGGRTS